MKAFTKGQHVHVVRSWDDRGTFYVVPAIVYAAGAKRMVLTDLAGECIGRDFLPAAERAPGYFVLAETDDATALAFAVEKAAAWLVQAIEHIDRVVAMYRERGGAGDAYFEAMTTKRAVLAGATPTSILRDR